MTAQEVIKAFVAKLANHSYSYSGSVGTSMLDSAVQASSRFNSIQDVIDAMEADHVKAEKEAVQEVLGSEYTGQLMTDLSSDILSTDAKTHAGAKAVGNAFINGVSPSANITVGDVIKERKAYIFLEKYCGIQLPTRYWLTNGSYTWYADSVTDSAGNPLCLSGNVDTGAITGSDANITLHSGDTDYYGNTIDLSALVTKYGLTLENDGSLIIGTGTEKTDRSVVPETFINTYTATTTAAQKIITDNRDWVVKATDADDTITSGGADSINAGAGNDIITVNGDGATVTSGDGSDNIEISAQIRDVAISDLTAEDTMTINGSFEIGAAKIEDMMLIITDKSGKRKLRLGDFTNATNGKLNIGGASMTIGQWLTNSGIDLNNLETTTYAASVGIGSSNVEAPDNVEDNDGSRINIDPEYTPTPLPESVKTAEPTLTGPSRSSNTSGDSPVTVNLANVDTSTAGNIEVDGQVVGSTSSTYPDAITFTRNGLTVHLLGTSSSTSGNPTNNGQSLITPLTLNDLTDDQKAIIAGLFKWWAAETINLNEESYGIGFNSDTTMCKDIGLFFYNDGLTSGGGTLATVWNWQRTYTDNTGDGFTTQLMLNVNMRFYSGVDADKVDGEGSGTKALLDRTLAHEMNHAIFASNINYFNSLPKFIKEGIAELTHGIDDERTSTIFKIAYDAEELDASLAISNTGTGTQEKGDGYAGGFMFYRYLAKQAALQTLNLPAIGDITATVNLSGDGTYYIMGNSTFETAQIAATLPDGAINLGTVQNGVYTVENSGVHQVINGSANVKIVGLTANDTYDGTSGADTVETAEGSNIITGAGNDSILLNGQYSTINAGAGDDTIDIVDGGHHSINLGDGSNLVSIGTTRNYDNTIIGGANGDTINGDDGKAHYHYNNKLDLGDGNNKVLFYSGQNNTVTTGAGDDTVSIRGGQKNLVDSGAGNDLLTVYGNYNTINAGAGDDTVNVNSSNANAYNINLGEGNNVADARGSEHVVSGGSDKDSIYVVGHHISVYGGAGNDTINVSYYSSDNDADLSLRGSNYFDAGEGNDYVTLSRGQQTIIGGAGNDTILQYSNSNGGNAYLFSGSFGDDSISGFMSNDTIHIAKDYTTEFANNVLTVKKGEVVKGTIKISGTFDATKNIVADLEEEEDTGSTIEGLTYNETGNYYEISTADDLTTLATYVNSGGNTTGLTFKLMDNIALTNDLDLSNFAGTFNGDNHLLTSRAQSAARLKIFIIAARAQSAAELKFIKSHCLNV